MTGYLVSMLKALLLTVIAEGLSVFFLTKKHYMVMISILCNLATNPLLNILRLWNSCFYLMPDVICTAVLEVCAVIAEAVLYHLGSDKKWKDSFLLSLIANGCSLAVGALLYPFL